MMKFRKLTLFLTFTFLIVACGPAQSQGIQVTDVWARPGLADGNSAIFFVIENSGSPDNLISASSDVAAAVELHKTSMQDGVMKMEHQMEVPIPAGKTEFKPGDLHVMMIGLHDDLNAGDTFTVRLDFEQSGEQEYVVTVKIP